MRFKYLKLKELQKLTISLLSEKHKIAVRNAGNYVTRTSAEFSHSRFNLVKAKQLAN